MSLEFVAWPKTPRLFRDVIITEKIDGTNAGIIIQQVAPELMDLASDNPNRTFVEHYDGLMVPTFYEVGAQSRKRIITPDDDNFGFARWVHANAGALVAILGEGRHYGEWWGSGIQRGYGLEKGEKRFSLFNINRYAPLLAIAEHGLEAERLRLPGLDVVPLLGAGPFDFDTESIHWVLADLRAHGSSAAPGFMNPEGIVVYHTAASQVFKVLLENDDVPKGLAA